MTDSPPKVVVLGSLHYDIMVDAPDRPRKGETLTGRSWGPKCGGKGGNQAVAAARQGARTVMVGAVGSDDFGQALLANLDRAGVDRTNVARLEGVGSGMSVAIFDDDGDYGAVIVSGSNLVISADQCGDAVLRGARVLILQNEVPEAVNAEAARVARQHGVITILNAAPARAFATHLPDLIDILVVNAIEAEMLGGGVVNALADALKAAKALTSQFESVLVTAGGEGVAFADRSGVAHVILGIPVVVESTHGAGDTFVGTFAAALARGVATRAAIEEANRAAAVLVSTPEANR
jgi:ribokinase